MIDYKYPTIAYDEEENKLDISLPSGEQIQEPEDFRKSKN
jgi:hypothetical protein